MLRLNALLRSSLLLAPLLALAGCGGSGQTSLAKLANNQDAYLGKQVSTSGTVESESNANGSRYYVLTDAEQDLVVLVPSKTVRRYVGDAVVVSGRFGFEPHAGRLVRIGRIRLRG